MTAGVPVPGGGPLDGELERPTRPPGRSTRVVEAVAVAQRILDRDGASALTMRRLADEMGIQAPSLYKHFSSKSELELAVIEDAMFVIGDITHRALHGTGTRSPLHRLLTAYRRYSLAHPNLYRLATSGQLRREGLPQGLEAWAGNPWFVVTQDAALAQALWSFAHGMVILELDGRYPPGSDLDETWRAGATAFQLSAPQPAARS